MSRDLSVAQHRRLWRMEEEEPEAKVVGWQTGGPLVARPDRCLSRINRMGRLIRARKETRYE